MLLRDHLKRFRLALIKKDFIQSLWMSYAVLLIVFISVIVLESVFYFPPKIKYFMVGSLLSILLVWIIGLGICTILIQTNSLKRYRWSRVAQYLGKISFTKKDSVINALQLENTMSKSSSTGLSHAFISKITDSLAHIDHRAIFTINPKGKYFTLFLLFLITVGGTGLKYTAGDSIYRWFHLHQKFEAPKPFYLHSETGDIHLLGGDSAKINIVASHLPPDTVFLEIIPMKQVDQNIEKNETLLMKTQIDTIGNYTFKLKDINRDYTY
ncbi:uncharacterized protein METZ01_LOCUS116932, partial [marine metagenome]